MGVFEFGMQARGPTVRGFALVAWLATCYYSAAIEAAEPSPLAAESATIDFDRDVRPIFNQHCVACHGGVKQAADLSLVYEDSVLDVIEAGSPEDSYLLEKVTAEDPDERMPPAEHGRALNAREIEILKQWVRQGAKWEPHWGYRKPQKSTPPADATGWSRQRMDAFIRQRLAAAGLEPSPDASPARWLRRVTLDLTGLPPDLKRLETFLADVERRGEAAYEAEVDRLLNSAQYGERWASVWLDLVRYADSRGLGQDGRREIWKYRDWVIQSLNQDLPFDQFTIKQLAGDQLPSPSIDDLIATACHRNTQTNEEGGTDDEEFRIEAVIDRVNTTWQVWQGLTFGCVQCHSHPYEPIRHEEYYQFLAYFNNSVDTDLSSDAPHIRAPLNAQDDERAARLDHRIAQLRRDDWLAGRRLLEDPRVWAPLTHLEARTTNKTPVAVETRDGWEEYHTVGTVSRSTGFHVEAPLPPSLERLTAIKFTGVPLKPKEAAADPEWGFVLSHFQAELLEPEAKEPRPLKLAAVIPDQLDPLQDASESLNPKSAGGFGAYSRIHFPRRAAFVLAEPLDLKPGSRIRISTRHDVFELGAFPLVARRGRFAVSSSPEFQDWLTDEALVAARRNAQELEVERKEIASVAIPVMLERPAEIARPTHVFERGNFLSKGDLVEPSTPDILAQQEDDPRTRLEMARWLVSPDNPLTARVIVNRLWAEMFDLGLVETQEDFGSSGEPPSHPQLLDDLAVRFATDMEWSLKALLRELALSSTYRQSARVDARRLELDPDNRLLSRGPRGRLPAEMVRDQALSLAGLLSLKQYGPPVHPPIPDGVWKPFQGGDPWKTPGADQEDRYRRSVYTYTKRSIPYPMFASFDAPSREFCTPRRLPSNTPLQALMTLNDQTFAEANEALADLMLKAGKQPSEQLAHGMRRVTLRDPDRSEVQALVSLYQTTLDDLRRAAEEPAQEIALQRAALTNVASVLLNLDEVLCK